jgi:hypothetical protein
VNRNQPETNAGSRQRYVGDPTLPAWTPRLVVISEDKDAALYFRSPRP